MTVPLPMHFLKRMVRVHSLPQDSQRDSDPLSRCEWRSEGILCSYYYRYMGVVPPSQWWGVLTREFMAQGDSLLFDNTGVLMCCYVFLWDCCKLFSLFESVCLWCKFNMTGVLFKKKVEDRDKGELRNVDVGSLGN